MNEPYTLLHVPYDMDQIRVLRDEENYISGVVDMDLSEIATDFESFLDTLSSKLTGTELLMNITYRIVGCTVGDVSGEVGSGSVHIEVRGDLDMILDMESEYVDEEDDDSTSGDVED